MKTLIILFISILFHSNVFSSEVIFKIQLLTPELLGDATIDKDTFFPWFEEIQKRIKKELKREKGNFEIAILYTFHSKKIPDYSISSRPLAKTKVTAKLTELLESKTQVRTKNVDYSLMIYCQVNKGCSDSSLSFIPEIVSPNQQDYKRFISLDLSEKKKDFIRWNEENIIPIASYFELKVEDKYAGVKSVGEMLSKKQYLLKNTEALFTYNSNYWRGIMEMAPDDQIVLFTRASIHIHNSEFDMANRILQLCSFFNGEKTIPSVYSMPMNGKMNQILTQLEGDIQYGISFHNKGKYKTAIKYYENLLQTFPYSAWLNYELYFSKSFLPQDSINHDSLWAQYKKTIYKCDPLYPLDIRATNGTQAYLLFRRKEISGLFKDKNTFKADLINYADISLDLREYDFAAQVYWLIYTHFKKDDYNNRSILAHFLYCQKKLGNFEIIELFDKDFSNEFEKIEKTRMNIMKSSLFYNAFKNN